MIEVTYEPLDFEMGKHLLPSSVPAHIAQVGAGFRLIDDTRVGARQIHIVIMAMHYDVETTKTILVVAQDHRRFRDDG